MKDDLCHLIPRYADTDTNTAVILLRTKNSAIERSRRDCIRFFALNPQSRIC